MDTKREYQRYLKSDHWRRISHLARSRANFKCEVCREEGPIHCHHHRYPKNRADDTYKNLIVLCESCHDLAHQHTWVLHVSSCLHKGKTASPEEIQSIMEAFKARYDFKVDMVKNMESISCHEFVL